MAKQIPQRYTVAGEVDSKNDIFEGIGENNNTFIIGEVYPDPAYDPELSEPMQAMAQKLDRPSF